jgi:hypothetical protein
MESVVNSKGIEYSFDSDSSEEEKNAICSAFNLTDEEYEIIKKDNEKYLENFNERFPLLAKKQDFNHRDYVDLADFERD